MSASLPCVCVSFKKNKSRGQRLDRQGALESVQTQAPAQPRDAGSDSCSISQK